MFGFKSKIIVEENKIEEALTRGVEEVVELKQLSDKMRSGKELRVKLGIDPTSPNIHIGRSIPLLKLRDFQNLGHKIIFIIGDFTGVIGDTSDKDSERPMLSEDAISNNLKNYVSQAEKILDIKKCEIHYNSEWLDKLNYREIAKQADSFSLNGFISRENISKRLDEGRRISLRELLYPLMQGYDSVAIQADVEVGGADQRFNLLAGREMQRYYNQEPQNIITNPLIEGLDGRKMSSSWGNTINLFDAPEDMFGKVMSLRDELITKYFTLVTRVPLQDVQTMQIAINNGENPRDHKVALAKEIVRMYHGTDKAEEVAKNFENTFSKGEFPENAEVLELDRGAKLGDVLVENKIVESKSEWRRLVEAGAVSNYPDQKLTDPNELVGDSERRLRIGKKSFLIIRPK